MSSSDSDDGYRKKRSIFQNRGLRSLLGTNLSFQKKQSYNSIFTNKQKRNPIAALAHRIAKEDSGSDDDLIILDSGGAKPTDTGSSSSSGTKPKAEGKEGSDDEEEGKDTFPSAQPPPALSKTQKKQHNKVDQ